MFRRSICLAIFTLVASLAFAHAGSAHIARAAGGSISGTVYFDADMNGERDPGEPPAPGRTVQLVDDEAVPLGPTTKSASDGSYRFDSLSPDGHYGVTVVRDSDTPCINGAIAFVDGDRTSTQDLGVLPRGDRSVSGLLVSDVNENGVRDTGEPALGGWQIQLIGTLMNAECEVNVTTDDIGRFKFDGLYAGMYEVLTKAASERLPSQTAWQLTFVDHPSGAPGAYPNLRSPDPSIDLSTLTNTEGMIVGVHVLSGTGAVNAWIFNDLDLDGTMDAGEQPFDCCGIIFLRSSPLGLLPVQPYEPKAGMGHYGWKGLPAGDYKVALLTWRPASTAPAEQDGRPVRVFTLHEGETAVANFGFGPLPPEPDDEASPTTPVPPTVQPLSMATPSAPHAVGLPSTGDAPPGSESRAPLALAIGATVLVVGLTSLWRKRTTH
jgi:SdrD B-like domain